jgi:hypothetical protein
MLKPSARSWPSGWPPGPTPLRSAAATPATTGPWPSGPFAEGDPERAALLEGAAQGLRGRVGLPAWPHLRRVEAELVAKVRQRLGPSRFDQAFAVGSGFTQREAVAVVRDQRSAGDQAP